MPNKSLMQIYRLALLSLTAFALAFSAAGCADDDDDDSTPEGDPRYFRFAVLADTHIIDQFYVPGSESNDRDNESIMKTSERMISARTVINELDPKVELVMLVGDGAHNYPIDTEDRDFLDNNVTRFDNLAEIFAGFNMPAYLAFGNHDYDMPTISREFTHQLYKDIFGINPYYSVDHKGFKFILLNNFLGSTHDYGPDGSAGGSELGSLGVEQLDWLEAELEKGLPSFIFIHYPIYLMMPGEDGDRDIFSVLEKYKDTVRLLVAGHTHRWLSSLSETPPTMVMGSTRYDEDAYMIIEADTEEGDFVWLNEAQVTWGSTESAPY